MQIIKILLLFWASFVSAEASKAASPLTCPGVLAEKTNLYYYFIRKEHADHQNVINMKNIPRDSSPMEFSYRDLYLQQSRLSEKIRHILLPLWMTRDARVNIAELRSGDIIEDTDGKKITLDKFVGRTTTAHYWQVRKLPGWRIRLPLLVEDTHFFSPVREAVEYNDRFYSAMSEAKKIGLPVIDVQMRGGFVYVEDTSSFLSLKRFLITPGAYSTSAVLPKIKFEAFKELLRSLAGKRGLGLLTTEKINWSPSSNSWIITEAYYLTEDSASAGKLHPIYSALKQSMSQTATGEKLWKDSAEGL